MQSCCIQQERYARKVLLVFPFDCRGGSRIFERVVKFLKICRGVAKGMVSRHKFLVSVNKNIRSIVIRKTLP